MSNIVAEGVKTVLQINLNWNPSYSYATIPPMKEDSGPTGVYWRPQFPPAKAFRISVM